MNSGLVRFHPSTDPEHTRPQAPPARQRPEATYSSRKSRNSFWHFSATSSRTSGCWLPAPGSAAAARSMAALRVRTAEERPRQEIGRSRGGPTQPQLPRVTPSARPLRARLRQAPPSHSSQSWSSSWGTSRQTCPINGGSVQSSSHHTRISRQM